MPQMAARDPHEHHRVATPLELFFDLCFVVAIAQVAARLHHGIGAGHAGQAVLGFAMVFFAIWWAWMNFTWFASAYDIDDVTYRLTVLIQIAGVLVLAAGVPRAADRGDFLIITIGFVIMRVGLIAQWLRAAAAHAERRTTCRRYAIGVATLQLLWVGLLWLPETARYVGFFVAVIAEISVPTWAERAGATPWHPHHIIERYGLLTLIVLGESVLSATLALQAAFDAGHGGASLYAIVAGAPLIVFSMWWLYFDRPAPSLSRSARSSFLWGYGHYFVFASAAAVGAGLAVEVERVEGHAHVAPWVGGAAIAVPCALYIMMVYVLLVRPREPRLACSIAFPTTAALLLASIATGWTAPIAGGLLAGLVVTCRLLQD